MKRAALLVLSGLIALAALSCGGEQDADPDQDAVVDAARARAEEAAQALGSDLMQRLVAELRSVGPAAAARVCSEVAQDVAAAHSVEGLTVRRVSLKVRNPADAPDRFERDALLRLEELHRKGRLPKQIMEVVVEGEARRLRYLRPIVIMPACLACHGPADSIAPEVAQTIAERYPDDRATGYASGDLRGAISVTVALD